MRITKVINNNVVSVFDDKGMELILSGKGIGFQKGSGDLVNKSKIEKTFRIDNKSETHKFEELFKDTPIEHIQITSKCIDYAKKLLNNELNASIYITLMDHINIAIERTKQNMSIKNKLLWDIKQFYPEEFEASLYALTLVKTELGVDMPEDEAGFITMHFVNAQMGNSMPDTMNITRFMQDIFQIIHNYYHVALNFRSPQYSRFVTHLKYLGQKIFEGKEDSLVDEDEEFHFMIKKKYADSYECVLNMVDYIEKDYHFRLSEDEIMYLIIYVKRVIMDLQ